MSTPDEELRRIAERQVDRDFPNWHPSDQNAMLDALREAFALGVRTAADQVPTTWLDPLLTGPQAQVGKPPYGDVNIERLLRAVKQRILDVPLVSEEASHE